MATGLRSKNFSILNGYLHGHLFTALLHINTSAAARLKALEPPRTPTPLPPRDFTIPIKFSRTFGAKVGDLLPANLLPVISTARPFYLNPPKSTQNRFEV